MPTRSKASNRWPDDVTPIEARTYLERAAALETARPTVEIQAILGNAFAAVKLRQIDRQIPDLRAKAEELMTSAKLQAFQERSAREIAEERQAAEHARLGMLLSGALLQARHEEYAAVGIVPDASWQVTMPREKVARICNATEGYIASIGVAAENADRRRRLEDVDDARALTDLTYEEAAQKYLGLSAIEERHEGLDRAVGVRLDRKTRKLVATTAAPEPPTIP